MLNRRFSFVEAGPAVAESQAAFVACPMILQVICCPQAESLRELYRVAFERAVELHRPSRWAPLYAVCQN